MHLRKQMARMRNRTTDYYFDTVVLSNFALAGCFEMLMTRYGRRAVITPEVLDEIVDGVISGYPCLREIEHAADRRAIGLAGLLSTPERCVFRELLRMLAPGEASCIACAMKRGGIVATDDRTARQCCADRKIAFTGTVGILRSCCEDKTLSIEEADAILQSMVQAGFYSPVHSLNDLI